MAQLDEKQWHKRPLGFGESLRAAILIQSLAKGADFRAIVAECPFSTFEAVADQRVSRAVAAPLAGLLVKEAMLYVWLRYKVNLWKARPDTAISGAHIPILLIHGLADEETSPPNSIDLAHANQAFTTLWLVTGAKHTGAYAINPRVFEGRVLQQFDKN